jgi:hypothetical protein
MLLHILTVVPFIARKTKEAFLELPSRAIRAVVFADCAPLALGKVRSPALPMDFALP